MQSLHAPDFQKTRQHVKGRPEHPAGLQDLNLNPQLSQSIALHLKSSQTSGRRRKAEIKVGTGGSFSMFPSTLVEMRTPNPEFLAGHPELRDRVMQTFLPGLQDYTPLSVFHNVLNANTRQPLPAKLLTLQIVQVKFRCL